MLIVICSFVQLACTFAFLAIMRLRRRRAESSLTETTVENYLSDIYDTMHGVESALCEIRDSLAGR